MANGKILLVEGTDDEHVLKHICGNRDIPHLDEVEKYGSVEKLIESIGVRLPLLIEEGDVVGIVIDADTEISNRWKSIRNRIIGVGYQNVPDQPDPDGTILDPPSGTYLPRLGVWIMPNNQTSGILEDFLRFLVPQPNILFDHARDSVKTIPKGERRFKPLDEQRRSSILGLRGKKSRGCLSERLSPPASLIPMSRSRCSRCLVKAVVFSQ